MGGTISGIKLAQAHGDAKKITPLPANLLEPNSLIRVTAENEQTCEDSGESCSATMGYELGEPRKVGRKIIFTITYPEEIPGVDTFIVQPSSNGKISQLLITTAEEKTYEIKDEGRKQEAMNLLKSFGIVLSADS